MRVNNVTIGSVVITAQPSNFSAGLYNLKGLTGLESPSRRTPSYNLPGSDGSRTTNALWGARFIVMQIEIVGTSETDFRNKVVALSNELLMDSENPLKTITFEDVDGNMYVVQGVPTSDIMPSGFGQRKFDTRTIEFRCDDYRLYSSTENVETVYLRDSSGGVAIPTEVPLALGAGSGGTVTVTNNGDIESCPVVRLSGPLTSPTIRNQTTGKSVKYDSTILAGSYVDIDMGNRTAVDEFGNSVLGNVDPSIRNFWCLPPGDSTISFIHDGVYNADAHADITWSDAYISV